MHTEIAFTETDLVSYKSNPISPKYCPIFKIAMVLSSPTESTLTIPYFIK